VLVLKVDMSLVEQLLRKQCYNLSAISTPHHIARFIVWFVVL
jgi:hypothetical protein